jgi:hypothetical protein
MFNALKARCLYAKSVGKSWWALVLGAYGIFWGLDSAVEKWNLLGLKIWWDAHTTHLPSTWPAWLVGLLVITLLLFLEGSYRIQKQSEDTIDALTWPLDHPEIHFDWWGEIPHDHPDAQPLEATSWRPKPEYFQRGFGLTNLGGTAHEFRIKRFQIGPSVWADSPIVPRIDKDAKGFALIWLDIDPTVRLSGFPMERWNLLDVLAKLDELKNGIVEKGYPVIVSAVYRDSHEIWYGSHSTMYFFRDPKCIKFSSTTIEKLGLLPRS